MQPHQTSPNVTAELVKLQRKWSLNGGVSLLLVNVFTSATGQFCHIPHPGKCVGSGNVLVFGTDQTLMREQLFQVAQVDPGHVHALCLGSPCIYWDGDDGWWLGMELEIRGRRRSCLKQGKLPFCACAGLSICAVGGLCMRTDFAVVALYPFSG